MLKRGEVKVRRRGKPGADAQPVTQEDGTIKMENPEILISNGVLTHSDEELAEVTMADILDFFGNEVSKLAGFLVPKLNLYLVPAADKVPSIWAPFWEKHPTAFGGDDKGRASFSRAVSTLANIKKVDPITLAETMI